MCRKRPKYKGKHYLGIFECLDGGKLSAENRRPGASYWELEEHG